MEAQIQKVRTEAEQKEKVSCPHCGEDISSVCNHTDSQQELMTTLEKQKQSLATEIKTTADILADYEKQLQELKKVPKQTKDISKEQRKIDALAQTMQTIKRKELQSMIDTLQQQQKLIDAATKTYESFRQQADQLQSKQIELTKLQTQKDGLTTQVVDLQKAITEHEQSLTFKPDVQLLETTKKQLASLQQIQTSMQRLAELHTDLHQQILQRKDLEIRDQRLKNLHHILSKELMYVVLETALPSLFSIINALLAQVVEYQLHFALVKNSSDRLELEVEVEDSRGRRSINSLSGGQKVILKLARILAVASYMRLPLLLLDETINNLDADLIGRVAELIDDVIRKQDMTLYVVTHSPHIQQMSVWEEVVEVK
ncbi:MAG: hypothetical protein H6766_04495 [Candidatus Peribacteria bacterium]|nr:MAG: hypothetical protein H6766_04495 [Candidatus Peribacteria bacterium]